MELKIVPGRIAEKKERKNHKKRGCHHDEQRQGKDGTAGEIDGASCGVVCLGSAEDEFSRELPPASGCELHRDCCLSERK